MSMDREGIVETYRFEAAGTESPAIPCKRDAWQSLQLPANFVAGTIQYQVWNNASKTWFNAVDQDGAPLPTIAATPGMSIPVKLEIMFAGTWRFVTGAPQPAGLEFKTVGKT